MRTTHDVISSMKKGRASTEFACYVRNYTDRAIRLEIPFGTLERAAKMTDEEHRSLVERNRVQYAASPAQARPAATSPDTSAPNSQQPAAVETPPTPPAGSDDWRS